MIAQRCVVLFCDVHEWSKAASGLGDRVGELAQDLYETLGEPVVRAHGSIVKYMGDSLLAVFSDKAEVSAVRCALEMREAFRSLAKRWSLPETTELEVGITAGRVIRGTFGHPSRVVEDVFGEEVSIATIIGHHRGIAVTGPVREGAREAFAFRPLPPQTLKWRSDAVAVWAVDEAGATPARG
jgi:class 3 adenylate cyclase